MKRIILILLALAVLAGTAAARGQGEAAGAAKKTVTLKYLVYEHPNYPVNNDTPVLAELLKKTGVKIEWVPVPDAGYTEKLNLILASGDIPDLASMNISLINEYSQKGAFLPLEDLIDKYAPSLRKQLTPQVKIVVVNIDKKIYGLPTVNEWRRDRGSVLVRDDYLKKLGIKEPDNIAELEAMLRKFKASDVDGNGKLDTIPWAFQPSATFFVKEIMGPSFGMHFTDWTDVNGKLVFRPTMKEYRNLLTWLAGLYKDGLIDKEYALLSAKQWEERVSNGIAAATTAYVGRTDYFNNLMQKSNPQFNLISLTALAGSDGKRGAGANPVVNKGYCTAISKTCKDPATAIRLLDFIYSKEGTELLSWGIEGVTYVVKDGKRQYSDEILSSPLSYALQAKYGIIQLGLPRIYMQNDQELTIGPGTRDGIRKVSPYYMEPLPVLTFTKDEQQKVTEVNTAINPVINKYTDQAIMGEVPVSDFDAMQEQIKKLGVETLVQIYNTAYARYQDLLTSLK
jgi:putative aldouronate transport system substrate-binding protein